MEQHYGCKLALRSPAHTTLVPPFNMSSDKEPALGEQLSLFCSGEKSFSIHLHHFDSFAPKVIFVHVQPGEELLQIKYRLDEHLIPLKGFSFKKEQHPFHPHITIANRDLAKKILNKPGGILPD